MSNINKIQTFQNIALGKLINASPYVSNHTNRTTDLKNKTINKEAKFYKRFCNRIDSHENPLIQYLASTTVPGNLPRRLKRKWCHDFL